MQLSEKIHIHFPFEFLIIKNWFRLVIRLDRNYAKVLLWLLWHFSDPRLGKSLPVLLRVLIIFGNPRPWGRARLKVKSKLIRLRNKLKLNDLSFFFKYICTMKELKSGREKQLIFSPRLGRLITPGESTKIMSEPFIKSGLTSKLKVLWTEVSFCF